MTDSDFILISGEFRFCASFSSLLTFPKLFRFALLFLFRLVLLFLPAACNKRGNIPYLVVTNSSFISILQSKSRNHAISQSRNS